MFNNILFLWYNFIGDDMDRIINNLDLFLLLPIVILPLIAQVNINSTYKKYAKVKSSSGITGKDVARRILDKNGLNNVTVNCIGGSLTDHYSPKDKNINLSESIYKDSSISSISVAAHECGHAIQDKVAYSFFTFRSKLVPVVNITSKISTIFILLGFFLELLNLLNIGIVLLCAGLLFQLVTLPVEYNASRRGRQELLELGIIKDDELKGVKKVLGSAALTYVAAFIVQALQVLRLVMLSRRRS